MTKRTPIALPRRCRTSLLPLLLLLMAVLPVKRAMAQSDTMFWFAVPDLSVLHQPTSIRLCVTSYDDSATVTVAQPANSYFSPITLTLPANGFATCDLSALGLEDSVETLSDTILNRGLRISSTSYVSCYYESVGNNSEIFTLKGRNALGTEFLVPMQSTLPTYTGHLSPSSIEIVATEDSTVVKVIPTADIVGGVNAGDTLTLLLHRGQCYAVRAAGYTVADHLGGTRVLASKPVAVNSTDDCVDSQQGCIDLMGDQIVPVTMLGTYYVAVKNSSTFEHLYVYPLESGTTVQFNNGAPQTVSPGSHLSLPLTADVMTISSDKPVAVFQMTATGCEVGGTMLPHMECTGSFEVTHLRPNLDSIILTIVISTHAVGDFTLNGSTTAITAADFSPIPNEPGLSYCLKNVSSFVEVDSVMKLTNSVSRFQLGILDGGYGNSCSYGFFCDYSRWSTMEMLADTLFCAGDDIIFTFDTTGITDLQLICPDGTILTTLPFVISNVDTSMSGRYFMEGIDSANCFRPLRDSIDIRVITPTKTDTTRTAICPDMTYTFFDSVYTDSGTYRHFVPIAGEVCDSIYVLELGINPHTWSDTVAMACDSIVWRDSVYYTDGNYMSLPVDTNAAGCDSTRRLVLTVHYDTALNDSIIVCPGMSFIYNGVDYGGPVSFDDLQMTVYGCDSLIHVSLIKRDTNYRPTVIYSTKDTAQLNADTIVLGCAPDTLTLRDTSSASVAWMWMFVDNNDTTVTATTQEMVVNLTTPNYNLPPRTYYTLIATDSLGCNDTISQPVYVFISPTSAFHWDPTMPPVSNPVAQFFNQSTPRDSLTYLWNVESGSGGGIDTTSVVEPRYSWGEVGDNVEGDYAIKLISYWTQYALDTTIVHTCTDTTEKTLTIVNDYLQFPNAVTPNGDGINDRWKIVNLIEFQLYPINELWIYNQWGALVFHARNIKKESDFWAPDEHRHPDGTYYYRFMGKGEYGIVKRNGAIEVVRGVE